MQRETLLSGGAAVAFGALLVAATLVPASVASPTSDRVRESELDIRETSIAAGEVTGETAALRLTTRFRHEGTPSENVTVLYRALDTDTGLVVTRKVERLGNVTGDREVSVETTLAVPREGDYRLETVVFEDGRRLTVGRTTVEGVGSLQPAYARSPVRFHQFAGETAIPPIEYTIESAADNRTRLNVSTYLTNGGDETVEDLRVVLKARQADSNIVADSASVPVGDVRPGRSATPSATLEVPDDYNYYLDAVLWKDGVIVGSTRAEASLSPRRTIEANVTETEVDVEAGDFEEEAATATQEAEDTPTPAATDGQPGFGVLAALVALGASLLVARRWSA
jgi:PGF-CTERM protein